MATVAELWERGKPHDPRSEEIGCALAKIDRENGNCFDLDFGGDGDYGEHLLYLLDIYFMECSGFIVLKDIREEQPEMYEEVLIVSSDKLSFEKASYMLWDKGAKDEFYTWYNDGHSYEFNIWPYWARWEGSSGRTP